MLVVKIWTVSGLLHFQLALTVRSNALLPQEDELNGRGNARMYENAFLGV